MSNTNISNQTAAFVSIAAVVKANYTNAIKPDIEQYLKTLFKSLVKFREMLKGNEGMTSKFCSESGMILIRPASDENKPSNQKSASILAVTSTQKGGFVIRGFSSDSTAKKFHIHVTNALLSDQDAELLYKFVGQKCTEILTPTKQHTAQIIKLNEHLTHG